MPQITTDPINWVTGALGNTIGGLLLAYFSFTLGGFLLYFDPYIFLMGLFSIPMSLISLWGFILVPITVWVGWALIFDVHNKYMLCALNVIIGAIITAIGFEEYFAWYSYLLLCIPSAILFMAWFTPIKKGITTTQAYHPMKRFIYWLKFGDIEMDTDLDKPQEKP